MAKKNNNKESENREILISRIIDAPRERVWKAWTDPKQVAEWWGPNGFTNTIHEMAVKPGGVWRFIMHGPDGTDYKNKIVFNKIVEPELIDFTHVSGPVFHTIVTFENLDGKTKLTMRAIYDTAEELEYVVKQFGAVEGAKQTIARLEEYLKKTGG